MRALDPRVAIADLKDLRALTGDTGGAQRVAFTHMWSAARAWFRGRPTDLPSGPLHDAAEMSRTGVPTAMLFAQSVRGLSHAREEDTRDEDLALAVEALDRLASRATGWIAGARE
ncbi:MAG TPA: M20/M25/M40 family metallo-hydrolase [Thermoleophilia bacterium]|nr:M20/M25/M40 family metallo-hydrolase [Thermoleophilia bacterium]